MGPVPAWAYTNRMRAESQIISVFLHLALPFKMSLMVRFGNLRIADQRAAGREDEPA